MTIRTAAEHDTALIRLETFRRINCSRSFSDAEDAEFNALCNDLQAYKAGQRGSSMPVQTSAPASAVTGPTASGQPLQAQRPSTPVSTGGTTVNPSAVMRRELIRAGLIPRDAA